MLAAGGEGAWIGTPLLATHEAVEVSDRHKKCIVESDGQDTVYTEVWDIMYDMRFPAGIAGRSLVNRVTREWHGRESAVRQRREELAALNPFGSVSEKDPDVHPIWMGQSAGAVHGVRTVAEVLQDICDGAEQLCASAPAPSSWTLGPERHRTLRVEDGAAGVLRILEAAESVADVEPSPMIV